MYRTPSDPHQYPIPSQLVQTPLIHSVYRPEKSLRLGRTMGNSAIMRASEHAPGISQRIHDDAFGTNGLSRHLHGPNSTLRHTSRSGARLIREPLGFLPFYGHTLVPTARPQRPVSPGCIAGGRPTSRTRRPPPCRGPTIRRTRQLSGIRWKPVRRRRGMGCHVMVGNTPPRLPSGHLPTILWRIA